MKISSNIINLKKIQFLANFLAISILISESFNFFQIQAKFEYKNEEKGYSFQLPDNWIEIPKSTIDKYTEEVFKNINVKKIEFKGGFQLKENNYFEYPYILIQEYSIETKSYQEIEKVFLSEKFEKGMKKAQESISSEIKDSKLDKPIIDKNNNRVYMGIEIEGKDGKKVKGIAVLFIGQKNIIQMNLYSNESEFNNWYPVFESIINSFEFKDGFKYDEAKTNKSSFKLSNSLVITITIISILSLISLTLIIVKLVKKNQ